MGWNECMAKIFRRMGWTGKIAYDNWKLEGFYIDPHEYWKNDSKTKMVGFNAEYNRINGLSGGFTDLNVFSSEFPYFYPDYSQTTREGLNAMNLRLQWMPRSNESFLFAKAEGGYQINNKIPWKPMEWHLREDGPLEIQNGDLQSVTVFLN